jgi:excisionase family DNA binding protein
MADHMTPTEAASRLDVSPSTVRRMCDDGTLQSWTTPGGHRRIDPASVDQYAKQTFGGAT